LSSQATKHHRFTPTPTTAPVKGGVVLSDPDTRRLLVNERAELLAREMRAGKRRDREVSAPLASRLRVAARRIAVRPRLTL
jgi:hypothetical protein